MQRQPPSLYVCAIYMEDGTKVQNYVTTESPPQVGEFVAAKEDGAARTFEVLNVRYGAAHGFDVVVLTVRPIAG